MKRISLLRALGLISLVLLFVNATNQPETSWILADAELLKSLKIPVVHEEGSVGLAKIEVLNELDISIAAHAKGRCGGFEKIQPEDLNFDGQPNFEQIFSLLRERAIKERAFQSFFSPIQSARADVTAAVGQVSETNLKDTVTWLSSFSTRYHDQTNPNVHVTQLKDRLDQMIRSSGRTDVSTQLVDHRSTKQKTLKVTIPGASTPNEILVLGGHLDSINQSWFGAKNAPGADDDASGSANLVEALRILLGQKHLARTIEIFWYAGEEGGLLGSSEIAKSYKSQGKDVIGVVQLDMTLHPGSGELVIGSMTDFTSRWMRDLLVSINQHYLKARVIEDKCGYGCSDHASWSRQGFPALMPFESDTGSMNSKIHTDKDVIDSGLSFRHSAVYSKLAVAFALELGDSNWREP